MSYQCSSCQDDITKKVYDWSEDNCGKPLCWVCQTKSSENSSASKIKGKKRRGKIPTPEAHVLYLALKKRGFKATYEKWDGYKHIDIAIIESKVNIEVDGAHHNFKASQALRDLKRTFHSFKKGYVTLRIPNPLVKDHLEETADYIAEFLNDSNEQLDSEEYD